MKRIIDSLLSAFLSFITPGLGQLRNGQLNKAIIFYLLEYIFFLVFIWLGLLKTFQGLIFTLVIFTGFVIFIIIDAFYVTYKTKVKIKRPYNKWFIYILILIFNIIVSTKYKNFVKSNYIEAFKIPTGSMEPTIKVGDHLIADYRYYKKNPVIPFEVIVFRFPKNPELKYIERCIAVGGQVVEIKDKSVFVDGNRFKDSLKTQFIAPNIYPKYFNDPGIYPKNSGNRDNYGPIIVPQNHCFVLGDNRDNSFDSRYWGFVPFESVIAKPLYIYWARDKSRIGKYID